MIIQKKKDIQKKISLILKSMHILIFITFRLLSLTAFFCNERCLISSASSAGQASFSLTLWCFATRLHPSLLQIHRTALGHKPPNPNHYLIRRRFTDSRRQFYLVTRSLRRSNKRERGRLCSPDPYESYADGDTFL